MWESRVLCEISKSLWKPFLGFHRDGISIAVFVVAVCGAEIQGCWTLAALPIVAPGASYAAVSEPASHLRVSAADHRRRFGIKGPGARFCRDDFGAGADGVDRERSVR